jgi:translation initiation factor IF-1
MPNVRGGKGYKKFKKGGNEEEITFIEKESDQFVGCLMKLVGSLNASVFCEDNKTRICKIAEGIKKKVRFYVGDIVLLSYRDDLISKQELQEGKHSDRGDILGKYPAEQYSQLKAAGINPHIFRHIDTLTSMAKSFENGEDKKAEAIAAAATNDDLFESANEEEEEEEHVTKPKVEWKAARAAGVKSMAEEANQLSEVSKPKKNEEDEVTLDDL